MVLCFQSANTMWIHNTVGWVIIGYWYIYGSNDSVDKTNQYKAIDNCVALFLW